MNVGAFSGTVFHMAHALRTAFPDIEIVRLWCPWWFSRFTDLVRKGTNGRANPQFWRPFVKFFARRLVRSWRGKRVLVVTAVNAPLASELAPLVPVLNITDATFELMRGFYEYFNRYSRSAAAAAEDIERRSILLSVHNSFPSTWAADSAIFHYGAPQEKVSVDAWGPNLREVASNEVRSVPNENSCRLLFIGVDWFRKGGDVVCATAEILALRGIPIQLDLVGSNPPGELTGRQWLNCHGFLSKGNEEEAARLRSLIRDADLLFLPTRQDTYGMVFAEANAYGTPAVTRAVGGVGDVVRGGVNGIILAEDARPHDFADAIQALWEDPERLRTLRVGSRLEYERRLNWDAWAQSIGSRIGKLQADGCI